MSGWTIFWIIFITASFILGTVSHINDCHREIEELKRGKPVTPDSDATFGWSARVSQRGLNPAQTLHLGEMDEGEALKKVLEMGYHPKDIKSLTHSRSPREVKL